MAEIEIVYESGSYCDYDWPDYCMQCHTAAGGDLGCQCYIPADPTLDPKTGRKVIPFGDCGRAHISYARKGWVGKSYDISAPTNDPYNPHLNTVRVKLGRKEYDCVKVSFNGKVIYNNYDDEPETERLVSD